MRAQRGFLRGVNPALGDTPRNPGIGASDQSVYGMGGWAGIDLRHLMADQHPSLDGYEEIGESTSGQPETRSQKRARARTC